MTGAMLTGAASMTALPVLAQEERGTVGMTNALPQDGPAYYISEFSLDYVRSNPLLPSITDLANRPIRLGKLPEGYVAPRSGVETVEVRLGDFRGPGVERFFASAVQSILEQLRDGLADANLLGVFVSPDPTQISPAGEDLRLPARRELRILMTVGIVTEIRAVAGGDRLREQEAINHPLHGPILDESPIQPNPDAAAGQTNLLRKDLLDNYLFHKSRHPGRRVEVAVAPSEDTGGITVDYLISENRPLVMYAQLSNTGTKQTDHLRQRFGLFHTQISNNDDVLSLEYTTANFDDYHVFQGSYEFPWPGVDRLRARIFADWSKYTASDVGLFDARFKGESWSIGAEVFYNIYQQREFFLDLVAGFKYRDIEVDNRLAAIRGDESFFMPHIGLRFDRTTDWFSTVGSVMLEWNMGSSSVTDMERLGRFDPDRRWGVLKFDASHSFYLEPLLNPDGWKDPTTPESSTLAHEIYASVRGQYAFNNRLIPQMQDVIGGLYTVRGYDESIAAGDSTVVGTLEYRFHLPRVLSVQPEPRELFGEPFRMAPQYVYGLPDWDLIFRGFVDIGRTINHDRLSFESNETLIGAGIGAEFIFKRNLNIRLDWGFALRDSDSGNVDSGSNHLHFVATFLF